MNSDRPSTQVQQSPTFSRAKFDELIAGDQVLRQQLLQVFIADAAQIRQRVIAAAQAGRAQLGDALHRLKSTSHCVGGMRLFSYLERCEACVDMEQLAVRSAMARTVGELVGELERELVRERAR